MPIQTKRGTSCHYVDERFTNLGKPLPTSGSLFRYEEEHAAEIRRIARDAREAKRRRVEQIIAAEGARAFGWLRKILIRGIRLLESCDKQIGL